MYQRYCREQMNSLWSDKRKFEIMLEIEIAICEKQVQQGLVPAEALEDIKQKSQLFEMDPDDIYKREEVSKHDVLSFLDFVVENIGENAAKYLHNGVTSFDVVDNCFSIRLVKSADILLDGVEKVMTALKERAYASKDVICMGRTHGVHSEPMSFGSKFARYYSAFKRCYKRLKDAREEIRTCKVSGTVGNFAFCSPDMERYVAERFDLRPEPIASQVMPRDRHAMFLSVIAITAACIEEVATEFRHLQRSEVLEISEYFAQGQQGSSAMPHKRNPISSENLVGLARTIRGYLIPAIENIALWHERDICHSSVERIIFPSSCALLDFALHRLVSVLSSLVIHEENIKENLHKLKGLAFSQSLFMELIYSGMTRDRAYKVVQRNAAKVWDQGMSFFEAVNEDSEVQDKKINMGKVFDSSRYIEYINETFGRVFNE